MLHALDDLDQARGALGDDHQGLVQVAVGRGQRDATVPGQGLKIGGIDEPAQHQNGLDPAGRRPLAGAQVMSLAVGGEPAADRPGSGNRNIKRGTIGQHAGPFVER